MAPADMSDDDAYLSDVIDQAEELHVVGIVRPSEENDVTNWGSVLYTPELVEHVIELGDASAAVEAQEADPTTDIFTGLPFEESAPGSPWTPSSS